MNRQILLSLLAAASAGTPVGALANVNLNEEVAKTGNGNGEWSAENLSAPENWGNIDLSTETINVAQSMAGKLKKVLSDMPKGSYRFTAGEWENTQITITGNGVTAKPQAGGTVEFEVAANATEVIIEVASENNTTGFKFGKLSFSILIDNAALYTQLNTLLNSDNAVINTPATENTGLTAAAQALETRKTAAQALVDMLEGTDGDITLDTYKKAELGLYNDPSTIEETVNTLMADIKAHNDKVSAFDTATANKKTIASWTDNATVLQQLLDAQEQRITEIANQEDKKFVEEQCNTYINTIQEAINGYTTFLGSLNEKYGDAETNPANLNDPANADYQKVMELYNPINGALKTDKDHTETLPGFLPDDITKAIQSCADYKQVQDELADLKSIYDNGLETFMGIIGVNGTDNREAFINAYNEGVNVLSQTTRETATERKNDDTAKYTETKNHMQSILNSATDRQTEIDKATATAKTAIENLQSQLDALTGQINAEDACDRVKDLKDEADAIQTQIDNLDKWVKDNATNNTLTVDADGNITNQEYTDQTTGTQTALDNLKSAIDKANQSQTSYDDNNATLDGWLDALQKAVDAIAEAQSSSHPVISKTPVSSDKLFTTYDAIKTAIEALKAENKKQFDANETWTIPDDSKAWADNIDSFKADGVKLATAFKDADDLYKSLKDQQSAYDKYYGDVLKIGETKTEVGTVAGFDNSTLTSYKSAIDGFGTTIQEIIDTINDDYNNLTGNAQYTSITGHLTEWQNATTAADMTKSQNDFAKAVNGGNMTVLNEAYGKYNTALTAESAADVYGPTLNTIQDSLAGWKTKIDNQQTLLDDTDSQSDIPAYCATQNTNIKTLLDQMVADMDARLQAAKENVDNNKTLTDLLGTAPELAQWAEDNSTAPAQAGWMTEGTGLDNEYATLVSTISNAYNAGELNQSNTDKFKSDIETFDTKVKEWKAAVTANENAYKEQVAEGEKTAQAVTGAINTINAKYDPAVTITDEEGNVGVGIDGATYTTVRDLLSLLDSYNLDVTAIGNQAYDDFKNHGSVFNATEGEKEDGTKSHDIMGQYKDIQDNVAAILAALQSDYEKSVIEQNTNTAKELLTTDFTNLDAAYKKAVDTYNAYTFNNGQTEEGAILDTEYQAGIAKALQNHANIQEYFAKIEALKDDVRKLIHSSTTEPTDGTKDEDPSNDLLTSTDFDGIKTTVTEYLDYLNGYTTQVVTAAMNYATSVYNPLDQAANQLVDDAKTAMNTAGIPENIQAEYTADAENYISLAEAMWEQKGDEASLWMGNIIDYLGKVAVDTNAAARKYWDGQYDAATGRLDEINSELAAISGTDVDDYKTIVSNVRNAISTINQEEEASETPITDVKGFVDRLNEQMDLAEQALTDAKDADARNQANKDAAEAFATDIQNLWSQYHQMRKDVGTLDLTLDQFAEVNTQSAQEALDAAEETLANHKATANDDKTTIQDAIDAAKRAIDLCYNRAYSSELSNLTKQLEQIKLDFNNKKASGTDISTLTGWDTEIKNQSEALGKVSDPDAEGFSYTDAFAEMVKIEEALDVLQKEIGVTDPTVNSATDAADTAFTEKYDEVSTALGEAETLLGTTLPTVQDTYSPVLQYYKEWLEAIKTGFDNEGNAKPLSLDGFIKQLDNIKTDIDDLKTTIADAEAFAQAEKAKKEASDKAYTDTLLPALEALNTEYTKVETMLEHYGMTESWASTMAIVRGWLDADSQWLEDAKAKAELTDETVLPHATDITAQLNIIASNSTTAYTNGLVEDAKAKVAEAEKAVTTGHHADQETLDADLEALKTLLNDEDLMVTSNPDLVADVETIHDKIVDDAKALIESVKENTVVLGDSTQDGEVNMTDYMAMLQFILSEQAGTFDPKDKGQVASDINGDKRLDVGDLTSLLNIILGYSDAQVRVMAHMPAAAGDNMISLIPESVTGDVTRYALVLDNSNDMVNMQLDILLAEGQEIVGEVAGTRVSSLDMHTADLADGTHRVVFASPDLNNSVAGNTGTVLTIEVRGEGAVSVVNAKGTNTNASIFNIKSAETNPSLIDQIKDSFKSGIDKVYNVGGQMIRGLQRGVNILRRADGSTEKVYNNDNN